MSEVVYLPDGRRLRGRAEVDAFLARERLRLDPRWCCACGEVVSWSGSGPVVEVAMRLWADKHSGEGHGRITREQRREQIGTP